MLNNNSLNVVTKRFTCLLLDLPSMYDRHRPTVLISNDEIVKCHIKNLLSVHN